MASDLSSPPFTPGTHSLPLSPHDFPNFPYGTSSLSIHEYRKQQRTFEPSTLSLSRKVKRKRASSNLNADQQSSGSSLLNRSHFSAPLAFSWDHSTDFVDSFTYPQSHHQHSFSRVLRPYCSQRLRSKASDWSESNFAVGSRSDQNFTGKVPLLLSFKPPPGLYQYELACSEGGGGQTTSSASFEGHNVSLSPFSYPSDFSLSRFPVPPNTCEPTPPNSREGITPTVESKSPTVYHLRGASFDFINPRTSLRLEDIETPAELDQDFVDYFHTTLSMENRQKAKLVDITTPQKGNENARAKSTPPRSLFEDLPTAYNSITARTGEFKPSPLSDLPLHQTHVPLHDTHHDYESPELFDKQHGAELRESPFPKSRGPSSIRSRLSRLIRFGSYENDNVGPAGEATYEEDLEAMLPLKSSYAESLRIGLNRSLSDGDLSRLSQNESLYVPSSHAEDDSRYLFESALHAYEHETTGLSANSTIGDILDQYRRPDNSSPTRRHEESPNSRVRAATNRALFDPPGAAPTRALPPPPPPVFQVRPSTPFFPTSVSNDSMEPSAMSNYGDTHNLLYMSGSLPSVEASRGTGASKSCFQPDQLSSASTPAYVSDVERRLRDGMAREASQFSPTADSLLGRLSPSEINEQIQRDLKRLSAVSASSSISGNVMVLNSSTDPAQAQDDRIESNCSQESAKTSNSGSSASQEVFKVQRPIYTSNFAPVAAFSRNTVQPGINRLASFERNALGSPGQFPQLHNNSIVNQPRGHANRSTDYRIDTAEDQSIYGDDEGDQDWETIADSHTHKSFQTSSSWQDYSSVNNSNPFASDSFGPISVHPADDRYQHIYRLRNNPDSTGSIMVPSYTFGDGSGFPNRNALTAPTSTIYNQYIPPPPLPLSHINPFTSSPPQIDQTATMPSQCAQTPQYQVSSSRPSTQSQAQNTSVPPFLWPRANLSVVHEHSDEISANEAPDVEGATEKILSSNVPTTPVRAFGDHPNLRRPLYPFDDSDLSSEPGPEVRTSAIYITPAVTSPVTPAVKDTKKLEARSAKLSSGVDPELIEMLRKDDPRMGSSPLSQSNSFAKLSPLGPKANLTGTPNGTGMRDAGSSLVGSSSPITPPKFSPVTPRQSPRAAKQGDMPLQPPKSVTFREGRYSRTAVGGQTQLMEMSLSPSDRHGDSTRATVLPSSMSRGGYEIESGRRHVGTTNLSPEAANRSRTMWAYPHLLERPRVPAPGDQYLKKRQDRISWIVFGFCALIPPLLLVYGVGFLDAMISSITKGRIRHFGSRQKFWAKWLGIGLTSAIVLTIVFLLIWVKATQNSFP